MARQGRRAPRKGVRRRPAARRPQRRKAARRKPAARRKASAARRRKVAPVRRGPAVWSHLKQERLLDVRLRDLEVRIEGTWVEDCVKELWLELEERGIDFHPHVWLSNEFFSPGGVPGFAVPFYLTHPRLMRLERSMMLEVEGGTYDECLRILRHECGHALQHAYELHRRRQWQRHFGSSTKPYPKVYSPNPASRRFVQHLRLYYAQSHPDEDFAETFAVWMQPRHHWRRRYAGWPALRKLEYVDELMEELKTLRPRVRTREQVDSLSGLRKTLREHYTEKRAQYAVHFPDTYDRDLLRIFSADPRHRGRERASAFLRRHRSEIRHTVARWTGGYEFTIDQVLRDVIGRARQLRLRVAGSERRMLLDSAGMLAVRTVHFLYHRPQGIAL
jgi:hypothetical protein